MSADQLSLRTLNSTIEIENIGLQASSVQYKAVNFYLNKSDKIIEHSCSAINQKYHIVCITVQEDRAAENCANTTQNSSVELDLENEKVLRWHCGQRQNARPNPINSIQAQMQLTKY